MPEPIRIEFSTVGARELDQAFASVERRVRKLQSVEEQAARKTAATTRAAYDSAVKAQEKAVQRVSRARVEAASTAERSAKKQADTEIREAERAAKQREKIRERSALMSGRMAEREARAEAKAIEKSQQRRTRVGGAVAGAVGNGLRGAWGSVSGVAGGLGAAAGGYAISSAFLGNVQLRQQAAQLVNASRDRSGKRTAEASDLVGTANTMATSYGVEAGSVMNAMSTVSAQAGGAPGLKAFRGDLEDITKSAVAFGVSMEDAGSVYAAMMNAGVSSGEEARKLFQDLIAMGKEGSVEMSDAASESARIAGSMGLTSATGAERVRQSMALMQIANRTNVSPEMSRTSLQDINRDLYTGGKHFEKAGVSVFNQEGKVGNIFEILPDILEMANTKGVGGKTGLQSILGRGMFTGSSVAMIEGLNRSYTEGYTDKGGNKLTGKAAVEALINETAGATLGKGERDDALGDILATEQNQLARSMASLNVEVNKLVPQLTRLAQSMTSLTAWAATNPFKALGVLVSASIGREIAGAGIGEALKTKLGASLSALGVVSLAATTVFLTAKSVIDQEEKDAEAAGGAALRKEMEINRARGQLARGEITPEEAKKIAGEGQSVATKLANESQAPSWARFLDSFIGGATGAPGTANSTTSDVLVGQAGKLAGVNPEDSRGGFISDVMAGIKANAAKQGTSAEELSAAAKVLLDAATALSASGPPRDGKPVSMSPSNRSGVK